MVESFILLCAITALLELDYLYVGQFMISRPIFAGLIFGIVTGNFMPCVILGFWSEFLFLNYRSIGTNIVPNEFICLAVSVILYKVLAVPIYMAFFSGVLAAYAFSFCDTIFRKKTALLNLNLEGKIKNKVNYVNGLIVKLLFLRFSFVFIFSATAFLFFGFILIPATGVIIYNTAFSAFCFVPVIGLANLTAVFVKKYG